MSDLKSAAPDPVADPVGGEVEVRRVDGSWRRCWVEVDGHLLSPVRGGHHATSRGGVGISLEPGPHTVRAVAGRETSVLVTVEVVRDRVVVLDIARTRDRRHRWDIRPAPPRTG